MALEDTVIRLALEMDGWAPLTRDNGWWLVSPSGDARRLNYVMWPTVA